MSQTAPEQIKLPDAQGYPQVDWKLFLPVEGETQDQRKARLQHAVEEKNKVFKQREEFINNLPEEERLKYRENKLKKLEEKLRRKEEKLRRKQDKRSKQDKKDKKDKKDRDYDDKKDKKSHCKCGSDQEVEISIDEFVQFKKWENSFKKKRVNAMKYNAFCEWRKENGQVPQEKQENPQNQQ
ncbi:hypothetical protein TVAG_094370 [Trichomonas vaginalis G3]|uniref:Uncharacterized protein n=1 Tax=Trichomonas vaginalis (strain ATCC PRA-98 / G3) TaxID=412133 RepID=A2DBQ9_TRIV3|nr:hypothetical protein TVAGG3_0380890 [Trichomonas vaginalis G3]EAY22262.1 hypothetical protein TVAG_094370 [Trichomonas vaginalis G3]KAI5533267.1 hypothetical protein TVAGG3_0380890 [Trichomonas vaginalis G3]|eukprot:XP_001583248.1 hypothetical protein [Trichomonas vaginalis G3]